MARAETIARLFAPEALEGHKRNLNAKSYEGLPKRDVHAEHANSTVGPTAEAAKVPAPPVAPPPVAPGRSGFRIARDDVEPYTLDASSEALVKSLNSCNLCRYATRRAIGSPSSDR